MRSPIIEEIAPVAEIAPEQFLDPEPQIDDTYTKVVAVGLLAERLLEYFSDREAEERPAPTPKAETIAEYLDVLDETVQVVHDVCEREDHDAIADDFSRLDGETLAEVRATVGYVGPHFGIEIDFPGLQEE